MEETKDISYENNKNKNNKIEIDNDDNNEEEIESMKEIEPPAAEGVKITRAKASSCSKKKITNSSVDRAAERTRGGMSRKKSRDVIRLLEADHTVIGPKCYPGLSVFKYIKDEKERKGWITGPCGSRIYDEFQQSRVKIIVQMENKRRNYYRRARGKYSNGCESLRRNLYHLE